MPPENLNNYLAGFTEKGMGQRYVRRTLIMYLKESRFSPSTSPLVCKEFFSSFADIVSNTFTKSVDTETHMLN